MALSRREAFKAAAAALLLRRIPEEEAKDAWKRYTARYRETGDRELIAKIRAAREKHMMNLVQDMEDTFWSSNKRQPLVWIADAGK